MKIKGLFEKTISFKMKSIIEQYKSNKQDREFMKMDIELIKNNKKPRKKNQITDLFLILTLIVIPIFFSMPFIFNNTIRYEDKVLVTVFSIIVGYFIAMQFKTLQCNYILKRFNEIDNEEKLEDDSLKKRIAACNLYLK